jgi:hypothetical protein
MSKLLLVVTAVLLLCSAQAEAACEREWSQLLSRKRAQPGTQMDLFDGEIYEQAASQQMWSLFNLGIVPRDRITQLRVMASFWDRSTSYQGGHWALAEDPFKACRARYLADQLDASRLDRGRQDREAAAQAERDRLERERRAQGEAERQRREQQQRAILEAERLQREREEQERREREELDARVQAERERLDEEAAAAAAARAAARRRAAEEAEIRRRQEETKPFQARIANECVSVTIPEGPGYGGFTNKCDFDIYIAFCAYLPKPDSWASAFDCDKDMGGLSGAAAHAFSAAHVRGAVRIFYFACNKPSTPNVRYIPGSGFYGDCR